MNIRGPLSRLFSLNALIWMSMLIGLVALLCLAAAAWLTMLEPLGAPLASLLTGLGLLLIAVCLGVAVRRAAHKPESHAKDRHSSQQSSQQTPRQEELLEEKLRPLVGDRAAQWTREHTGVVMVGALAAGFLLAASPGVRRLATRAAGPVVTGKAIDAYKDFSNHG